MPPMPSLVIGRTAAIAQLKQQLGVGPNARLTTEVPRIFALRGLPGVGKTTLVSALAHDPGVRQTFPDGVLWTSLGEKPEPWAELSAWGRVLGLSDIHQARTVQVATALIAGTLRNKRVLLIVDDVWDASHAMPFKVGGAGCGMIITTRELSIAHAVVPTGEHVSVLRVLSEEDALTLLRKLAPAVVARFPDGSLDLVRELEGLPLGIQVAGRLLNIESARGLGVEELLSDLRGGKRILEAQAPADRSDLQKETIPTVAWLLQKSTDRLDPETRERFGYLGAFPHKPATFDLEAMKSVWGIEDPTPTLRILVDRGLLEYAAETRRYQLHALLRLHAASLCTD